jgi:DNA-binding transcriptional ArsR family regulator
MIIRDVETMRVIADKLRLQVLEVMRQPTTVKELAAELNQSPHKLYYHVNMLEEHGLIRVVGLNLETGMVEKVYQVAALEFKVRNPILAGLDDETAVALMANMLDEAQTSFLRAYTQRPHDSTTPPRHPFFTRKEVRLTEEQLTLFHQKLVALVQEVDALNETATAEEARYYLTLVFHKN